MITSIKLQRLKAGIAQFDLASRIGISPSRMSLIENGRVQATDCLLREIAKCLGVAVEAIEPKFKSKRSAEKERR